MDELINIIDNQEYSRQQVEYLLFEYFLNNNVDKSIFCTVRKLLNKSKELKGISKTLLLAKIIKNFNSKGNAYYIKMNGSSAEISEIEDTLIIVRDSYNNILSKTKQMADEFNISNSLELSTLFTALLYGGCYSVIRKHEYNDRGRHIVVGFNVYDIFIGGGVCVNYSEMLSDILTYNGYKAAVINNYMRGDKRILLEPLLKLFGNHAFTLIIEKGMPYIYDATNLTMLNCSSNRVAIYTDHQDEVLLKPYLSVFTNGRNGLSAIRDLSMTTKYIPPYSNKDFTNITKKEMNKYNKNASLFADFRDDIDGDINTIVEKGKVLIRRR